MYIPENFRVKCPHCDRVNYLKLYNDGRDCVLVICDDPEDGGCGDYYVISTKVNVEISTYILCSH